MERSSGVLMPLSSLPSKYGIGSLGKCAYDFVDFLSEAGQKYWQLLPMGPTSYGDSPYASLSTFAGNPYFIDLDMLVEDGLLNDADLEGIDWGDNAERVEYSKIYESRFKILRLAYARGFESAKAGIAEFCRVTPWVENYALYMAVKAHFGMKCWTEWEDAAIRKHEAKAVREYREKLREDVDFYIFIQYLFFKQWNELRSYAIEKGIQFIGDIPIYVALDSADVWSEPHFFQLDEENVPVEISGVPPDAFTEDGQLWGNPLYDWDAMKRDGYGWWIRRIEGATKLYDVIRIDHFRGFESYWACPYGDTTAKNGVWKPGPGMSLVGVLTSWFHGVRFIAEDLGYLTPEVKKLLADSGLPGMKVLEFAFDAHGESGYLPHRCVENSVCYMGTHDNDTVLGWVETTGEEDLEFARRYMHITEDEGWCWGLIRTGMATSSSLFVVQMQDVLELGPEARMNTPGTSVGNWQWRMLPDAITDEVTAKLRSYTELYRRTELPEVETEEEETEEVEEEKE